MKTENIQNLTSIEEQIFNHVVERLEKEYPGIGDESGQLSWKTLVNRVLAYIKEEVLASLDDSDSNKVKV